MLGDRLHTRYPAAFPKIRSWDEIKHKYFTKHGLCSKGLIISVSRRKGCWEGERKRRKILLRSCSRLAAPLLHSLISSPANLCPHLTSLLNIPVIQAISPKSCCWSRWDGGCTAAVRVQEASKAMPTSGRGHASPEHAAAGVTALWQGRTLQALPAAFWGYLQVPGGAWPQEDQQRLGGGGTSCTSSTLGARLLPWCKVKGRMKVYFPGKSFHRVWLCCLCKSRAAQRQIVKGLRAL